MAEGKTISTPQDERTEIVEQSTETAQAIEVSRHQDMANHEC
jgi:hypothetical protein